MLRILRSVRRAMRSVPEIIHTLGGSTATAIALGLPMTTVDSWKRRGSIPPEHWSPLVVAARKRGVALGLPQLAELAAAPRPKGAQRGRRRRAA